jgi:hypothetical protein
VPSAVYPTNFTYPVRNAVVKLFQPIATVEFDVFVRRRCLCLAHHEIVDDSTSRGFGHAVSGGSVSKIRVNRRVVQFLNKALVETMQGYLRTVNVHRKEIKKTLIL